MKSFITALVLFSSAALFAQPSVESAASGDPIASVQSGDWHDASTWDCSCVPSAANDVTIQSAHSVSIASGDTARVESIALSTGSTLELPEGTRIEVSASLASTGDINGTGIVALVGGEDHVCGPAKLEHLTCGTGSVTLVDTLRITAQLDLEDATMVTAGKLVLEGTSGITTDGGSLDGEVSRRFDMVKTSSFNHWIAPGLSGCTAGGFLSLPGAVYAKQWMEPQTAYLELVPTDTLDPHAGLNCSLPEGSYNVDLKGEALLSAEVAITSESNNNVFKGWNMVGNPLTSFVDITAATTPEPDNIGATYHWVDSLLTYVVQVNGLGQFGHRGIFEPGAAFWVLADTSFTAEFGTEAMASASDFSMQNRTLDRFPLTLRLSDGALKEECTVAFGAGVEAYVRGEDALFHSAFRGRNNMDLYTKDPEGNSMFVNRTTGDPGQMIPLFVKAFQGVEMTLMASSLPDDLCLTIEDVETGAMTEVTDGMSYTFSTSTNVDHHRFNLIVGGTVEATAVDAACASAQDGTIAVAGPDMTSVFSLADEAGNPVGTFTADSTGGTFSGLAVGTYTVTAFTDGCADLTRTVEVGAGGTGAAPFEVAAMPDHIGCYDDHGGIALDIEGGLAPYTVEWAHGVTGDDITVEEPGVFAAVITDAAGCSDSTSVEVFAAPQVEAMVSVDEAVITLIDGEAEVHFDNASTGATAYNWNFGDGGTSTSENPTHLYTDAGAYTVGLNAWNDYCSDTYQMVVTVETVSAIGQVSGTIQPTLARQSAGWTVSHPAEAFEVEVFDLTGRVLHRASGMPGQPVMLDAAGLPPVSLIYWAGQQSGQQQTWRVAR